ncbi:uncharacterized protein LOC123260519 [Cotesia glomerata]|uniref:uncharacterized protein LOC123260519 n=1 Tax=Cotesia glomerata TaxID=32391 RepID=UPI001D023846|nr:uncharacterized protein LOC123260519 [Cotesia glomerata]
MTVMKRHGGWKSSTVVEGYIADSVNNKKPVSMSKPKDNVSSNFDQPCSSASNGVKVDTLRHQKKFKSTLQENTVARKKNSTSQFDDCETPHLFICSTVFYDDQDLDLVADTKPHIIAITETWLKPLQDNSLLNLENFTVFRRDRGLTHSDNGCFIKGGGVACLVHKSLKAKVIYVPNTNNINQPEYLILEVISQTGNRLLLSVIYRRPQESSITPNHLQSFITELSLFCVPFGATHHSNNKDSWLDVIILDNQSKMVNFCKSNQPFINGHDYLVCDYKFDFEKPSAKIINYRDFSKTSQEAMSNALMQSLKIDSELIENSDPNYLTSLFYETIIEILEEFAPIRSRKITHVPNPWVTKELKTKCKERDTLKELKIKLTEARENYLCNALSNIPLGSNVWSKLKHLGLIKGSNSSPLNFFDSRELNNHFAKIVRHHPPCNEATFEEIKLSHSSLVNCSFVWTEIDIVDVTKALHLTLNKSKGKSPDELNLYWLKNNIPQITIVLTQLFNRSLNTAIFPQAWKAIYILPLNKTSPPRSLSDTRPIANTSHLSKVFERIIANQVVTYLEDNNLIDKYQSGFRKHHSTQSALLKLTNDISRAMDSNQLTLIVFFDLTKAFDYVNHKIIIKTLIELGFSPETVKWFLSYLSDRSQAVLDGDGKPVEFKTTTSGVPQGSVLGPILFLLVMNSAAKRLTYTNHGLFADDKYIYLHCYSHQIHEATRQLNLDAQAVVDWARDNGLEVNLLKTKAMLYDYGKNYQRTL